MSYFIQEGDESGEQTNGHDCCGVSPHPRERQAGRNGVRHKFQTFSAVRKDWHAVTAWKGDEPVGSVKKGREGRGGTSRSPHGSGELQELGKPARRHPLKGWPGRGLPLAALRATAVSSEATRIPQPGGRAH